MTQTTYVFVQPTDGAGWTLRTHYQQHYESVRTRLHSLLKQDYSQGGADAMPHRVMFVIVDPERPAETRMLEYSVELIEPRLVRMDP